MRKMLVALMTTGLWLLPAHAEAATSCPTGIAHRGDTTAGDGPESIQAEVRAAKDGAAAEFDVRYSSDGSLFAFHDSRLDLTTNGTGYISAYRYSRVKSFIYKGTDDHIATVNSILTALKPYSNKVYIELKLTDTARNSAYTRLGNLIANTIGPNRAVINSYKADYMNAYKKRNPEQKAYALDSIVRRTAAYTRPFDMLILKSTKFSQSYVDSMNASGIPVAAFFASYTPDDPAQWDTVSYANTVFTNYYNQYMNWCATSYTSREG